MSWKRLFYRRLWDREAARELEIYLEIETEQNIARGMPPDEARRAAHRKLGNATQIREEIYRRNSIGFLEILWHDVRYGFRMLLKGRGFTVVSVLTLALGIGANTAIFSVVNATLIRPLPYPNASRLVMVWERRMPDGEKQNVTSPATFLNWRDDNTVFEQIAAFYSDTAIASGGDAPEQVAASGVTPNLFAILGVHPALGRGFIPSQDGAPGAERVAVLSFELWQRRYGANPNVLGSKIVVDDKPRTVIGVMPPGFQFFIKQGSFSQKRPQLWTPMNLDAKDREVHGRYLQAIGLLRPAVTLAQAQSAMASLASQLEAREPANMKNWGVNLIPLRTQLVGGVEPALRLVMAAVGLVLLIACANVATLFLARVTARKHEFGIRMALGADGARVLRQIQTESCLIASLGGLVGLVLGWASLRALQALAPANLVPLEGVHLDRQVLVFTMFIAWLTGLLFGTIPALEATRCSPREPLEEGTRTGHGAHRAKARNIFVVVEIALALILLTGSGLLIGSFGRLLAVDPGFKPQGVLTAWVQLPEAKYAKDQNKSQFFARLLERLRAIPQVRSASADAFLPFAGMIAGTGIDVEGRPKLPPAERPAIDVAVVEPRFFETMGIPLLEGRSFSEREGIDVSHKVVISESMARMLWPNESAIGKGITIYMKDNNLPNEVIGVVGDVKHAGLDKDVHPTAYWPHPDLSLPFMTLVVRTDGDPMALAPAVRETVRSLDKDQPMADVVPMESLLATSLARARFATVMMAAFAAMALLLAVIGIYGLVWFGVEERTREIGIRLTLGASRVRVVNMLLKQGLEIAIIGIVLGAAASLALTRLMIGLLFATQANDPTTFLLVALLLGIVALSACYAAAWRVTRIEAITVLRSE